MNPSRIPPRQRIPIYRLSMLIISIILILGMWLLASSLDAHLGGEHRIVLPAAVASGLGQLVCWWLLRATSDEEE